MLIVIVPISSPPIKVSNKLKETAAMNPRALALEIALGWFNSETESFNDLRHKYQDDELLAALALLQRYITDAKKEIKSNPNGSDNRPDVPPSSLYIMGKKVDDLPNDT